MALVPFPVVTVTSTIPTTPAGESALIDVALLTANRAAAVPPKLAAPAPVKLVPVIVTVVPPAGDPPFGLTAVTVGVAGAMVPLVVCVAVCAGLPLSVALIV